VNVDDVLTLDDEAIDTLRSPVMVIALTGLFDIAGAASTTLDRFAPEEASITVGEIDPDPFYDFTQERPHVEIDDGEVRVIRWPENHFDVVRGTGGRDLVVLVGAEPHLYWRTYSECVRSVLRRLGCEAVVTVGSAAEATPHTRVPLVTGSTTDVELARRLGIGQPTYQGVTGVAGVLLSDLAAVGVPAVSLRVGVPHYLMNAEHPQAVAALQTHLAHVLNVPVPADDGELAADIKRWRSLHDEVVAEDAQLQLYVRMLEHDHDRRAEASITSADDLGAQFEQYLREQRDE
jgi:proteasome assembly chaperone (PAC2) family protein